MSDELDVVEIGWKLIESGFGVRYLVSSSYRNKVHARWSDLPWHTVAFEVLEGLIAFAVLGFLFYFLYRVFIANS